MRAPLHLAVLILAPALLGACATGHGSDVTPLPLTTTEQYRMETRERPDEILLAAHANGLSPAQTEALAALADRWLEQGSGRIVIQAPLDGADLKAVSETSLGAKAFLLALGVPPGQVERVGYEPKAQGAAPVIVGFNAHEAVIPKCGLSIENLSATGDNKPMSNFGCAVTANLAAQIANPGDIVEPQPMDPADAQRRGVVLGKYRQGETTSTAKDAQASGTTTKSSGGSS